METKGFAYVATWFAIVAKWLGKLLYLGIFADQVIVKVSKHALLYCWITVFSSCFVAAYLPAQTPSLERLGAAEGLSQGMIYDLLQDRHGFLWFATKDGLNRYDGYSFQVFQNNPFDPFSISDNELLELMEDHLGRIWIGTLNNGLSVLDPQTGKFYHLNKLSSQSIQSLAQTPDGSVWAGTSTGVNRVRIPEFLSLDNPSLEDFAQVDTFFWEDKLLNSTSLSNHIVDLMGNKDGKLWVSTVLQIGFFDTTSGLFQTVCKNPISPKGELLSSFFQESADGSMWVGQPGRLLRIRGTSVEVFQLPERSVFPLTDIAFDLAGNIFVSTRKQIFKLSAAHAVAPETARFDLFYRFPKEGIIGSTKLMMDSGGLLWIGTNGYGLLKYNPGNHRFHHYLAGKSPRRIVADAQGRVWVWQAGGMFRRLLEMEPQLAEPLFSDSRFLQHDCVQSSDGPIWLLCETKQNEQGKGFLIRLNSQTLAEEARFPIPFSVRMYSRLYEDKDRNLWVVGDKSQLGRFDPAKSQWSSFDFSAITGFREASLSVSMDAAGQLWIGTPHGLLQALPDAEGLKFELHKNNPNDPQSMNCNTVLAALDDPVQPERFLWLGTKGGGLNRFDKHSGAVQHFTTAVGLSNNVVYAVMPDSEAASIGTSLWLSTNCGLSKFDPKTGLFQNFFSVDGLQDNEFNTLSYARAADGRLYFGGVNGITAFYPSELNAAASSPPVFITRLKINNQPVQIGKGVLEKRIELTRSISLGYLQNQLTFEFAAMDFAAPSMNQFRYRLLGADQNWVESTTSNSATYANLAPGNYVFEVLTGGSRGIWNSAPARLEIHILPPWWRTGWAYSLYFLLFALSAWYFYRFQMNKIRLENKLQFEHKEALRLAELDKLKTNFFSSITHEFRTPLTLLLEPARQLLAEAKDRSHRYRLELIEKNAQKLLQFVNQLLDLSKLEAGQMPLDLRPGNPANTIRSVVEQFQPLALQNDVMLELELPDSVAPVFFDEVKLEQVLSNLLSNALKFTDKGGTVTVKLEHGVSLETTKKNFSIVVSDTGIGISSENLPYVFDRFYQTKQARGGTGIGLSLTKELIERMGGTIAVESHTFGRIGTSFIVHLPYELANVQQIVASEQTSSTTPAKPSTPLSILRSVDEDSTLLNRPNPSEGAEPFTDFAADAASKILEKPASPLLLLIEDDTELRQFLRASLPTGYRIAEAADGAEGIQMALELVPDLVISDLVMPQKNGFEVAETLKSNPATSHIPLILLTAKSAVESKMEGLHRGADAYLTKPFRADELVAHIENLLVSRQRLHIHFLQSTQNKTVAESAVTAFSEKENEFLQRLIQVVEANLDNEAMDAEAFARAVFSSRSQLHRKIIALTGRPLTEFVRNHRLDRARDMLARREGSVSEIAWRTGFQNAKYFSTCFKERFGMTPSGFVSGE